MSDCIEWQGSRATRGYPRMYVGGVGYVSMHRMVLAGKLGRPIKDGYQACHTCDNPPCVNRDHLFEGTATDNRRDCVRKGRARSPVGEASGQARLTDDEVEEVRRRRQAGETVRSVAGEFGISYSHVAKIDRGESRAKVSRTYHSERVTCGAHGEHARTPVARSPAIPRGAGGNRTRDQAIMSRTATPANMLVTGPTRRLVTRQVTQAGGGSRPRGTCVNMEERLWTIPEVADFLSVADSTVYRLAEREPDFPAAVRLSPRAVRYRPGEVRDWVRRRQTAADPEPQRRRRGKTPTV